MTDFYLDFRHALHSQNGPRLGILFTPSGSHVSAFAYTTNHALVARDVSTGMGRRQFDSGFSERGWDAWSDAIVAFWTLANETESDHPQRMQINVGNETKDVGPAGRAYLKQVVFFTAIHRGFTNTGWPHWCLPVLYAACRWMRVYALRADEENRRDGLKAEWLEDAARNLNKAFMACLSDRAPLEESRKWGTYYIVNLLFKTYFKLNTVTLSKNILRALQATTVDMPPLELFPKSHIVTFRYYVGVIYFLEEDYKKAEENLIVALNICHRSAERNRELILTYLIPAHLITTHQVPSASLYASHPTLQPLFAPICNTIRAGNLVAFDAALLANEDTFVRRRIYLTLERARDIALRNLFRKVFLVGEKKTRVPVETVRRAMGFALAGAEGGLRREVEAEEVECLLAGMIYKGLVKGYISREKGIVVLSNKEAFPGTGC